MRPPVVHPRRLLTGTRWLASAASAAAAAAEEEEEEEELEELDAVEEVEEAAVVESAGEELEGT